MYIEKNKNLKGLARNVTDNVWRHFDDEQVEIIDNPSNFISDRMQFSDNSVNTTNPNNMLPYVAFYVISKPNDTFTVNSQRQDDNGSGDNDDNGDSNRNSQIDNTSQSLKSLGLYQDQTQMPRDISINELGEKKKHPFLKPSKTFSKTPPNAISQIIPGSMNYIIYIEPINF